MSANQKRAYPTEHARLGAAERVLDVFRQEIKPGGTLSAPSIQARLALYRSNDDWTALCSRAAAVIEKMKKAHVARFDPFILCDTDPLERPLNNVIAQLLDPEGIHGLGLAPIRGLMRAAEPYAPQIVGAVLEAIEANSRVRVKQDYGDHELGFVDIALFGAGFVIFIENKKRWGNETITLAGRQIERYHRLLKNQTQPVQLGILLSPDGKVPSHASFVPLLSSDLAEAMRQEIDKCQADDNRLLVTAFLVSYKWFS